jgi:hypothetical protein
MIHVETESPSGSTTNFCRVIHAVHRAKYPGAPVMNRVGPSFVARWLLAAPLILLTGCAPSDPPTVSKPESADPSDANSAAMMSDSASSQTARSLAKFVDMTESSEIAFEYRNGEEFGHFSILESLGGGVGLFDYDNDGDMDLICPAGGGFDDTGQLTSLPIGLFRNEGQWKFLATANVGNVQSSRFYSHGAAVADTNNDGFADVLITGFGGLQFFENNGDGTFTETAIEAGLTDNLWSSSAAFGDLNHDGNSDLYVAHYVDWSPENNPVCDGPTPGTREVCSPRRFNPLPDILYLSNGDGTFRDATTDAGLMSDGKGLAVQIADVNLDGQSDIYVANDTVPNFLYRGNGTLPLEDVSNKSGASLSDSGTPDGSMGVDVGDFNLDGLPDIWVANYERESFALYRNEGNFFFQHISRSTGVTAVGGLAVGWGSVFFDFDSDGDEDVFVSNGHVIRYPRNAPLRQNPLLFQNEGGLRFVNVAPQAGPFLESPQMGRGVASGDLDNDGDVDLVISRINETVALLSNESELNRSLIVQLIGTQSNRDATGAWLTVRTTPESPVMTRQIKGGGSYASSSDRRQFFGIGQSSTVSELTVHWPCGAVETFQDLQTQSIVVLKEPCTNN